MDPIKELLSRSVEKIYPTANELEKALRGTKPLRVYLGVDPTSQHLHIGHAASLWILRRFQNLGHEVILLVGDFTARIGDPTDKTATRVPLTEEEIEINIATFKEQASRILNFEGKNAARLEYNSAWLDHMSFREVAQIAQHFTVQQMIERDMFQERIKNKRPIGLHEFLYPLMQGYDSVAMNVDVEVGGTDQTFNMLTGRTLMKAITGKEKFVVTNRLLVDTTSGKKLSKTEGSLVNLDDAPDDMFGKVMALPDGMIVSAAELSTDMKDADILALGKEKNPKDAKLKLAFEMVKIYHSEKDAKRAQEEWTNIFSNKKTPADAPELKSPTSITTVELIALSGLSKSEARRLIEQGGVELNEKKLDDPAKILKLKGGESLRVGKKKFFRIAVDDK